MSTHHDTHASHHHVSPTSLYWAVWGGLMVFTVITVLAYYIPIWLKVDLGAANVIIAMAIATTKATLVVLFFMGLKYDKRFLAVAFLSSLIFLGLFLGFTLLDINTRDDSQPFAKPMYVGKDLPLEGEHGAAGASHSAAPAPATSSPATGNPAPAPATGSPATGSPAAGHDAKEPKPAAPAAAPAGGAKH